MLLTNLLFFGILSLVLFLVYLLGAVSAVEYSFYRGYKAALIDVKNYIEHTQQQQQLNNQKETKQDEN